MIAQFTSTHADVALLDTQHQLMANFAQGNAKGVAALYAEDGQVLPLYSVAIIGTGAIQAFWQGCIDTGLGALQRQPDEVELLGTTAHEGGSYVFLARNGKVIDVGKYLMIWKQQAGQWKIYRDIWTSSWPTAI